MQSFEYNAEAARQFAQNSLELVKTLTEIGNKVRHTQPASLSLSLSLSWWRRRRRSGLETNLYCVCVVQFASTDPRHSEEILRVGDQIKDLSPKLIDVVREAHFKSGQALSSSSSSSVQKAILPSNLNVLILHMQRRVVRWSWCMPLWRPSRPKSLKRLLSAKGLPRLQLHWQPSLSPSQALSLDVASEEARLHHSSSLLSFLHSIKLLHEGWSMINKLVEIGLGAFRSRRDLRTEEGQSLLDCNRFSLSLSLCCVCVW